MAVSYSAQPNCTDHTQQAYATTLPFLRDLVRTGSFRFPVIRFLSKGQFRNLKWRTQISHWEVSSVGGEFHLRKRFFQTDLFRPNLLVSVREISLGSRRLKAIGDNRETGSNGHAKDGCGIFAHERDRLMNVFCGFFIKIYTRFRPGKKLNAMGGQSNGSPFYNLGRSA
jgi:hypothetical protein